MKNRVQSRPFALPFTLLLLLLLAALPAAAETRATLRLSPIDGGAEVEIDRPVAARPAPAGALGAPELRTGGVTLLGRAPDAVTLLVESVGVTGDLPTATDNDFTRIDEAIQAVALLGDGTTVRLVGTFDWSEPNAFASWEAVDYAILAPPGIADVTVRAAALGDAVIEGPGEIADPSVYYEGFLLLWGGTYHGWTLENLVVRGFDWPIGCFFAATGDFNNLTIRNNRIEMLADAPGSFNGPVGEPWQNLALHLSFGLDQTIEGNEFVLPGDGSGDDTDPLNIQHAATVVMQSNTSGGAHYDGLRIVDNLIRVTGSQTAIPERIYGFWENGHSHASNIEVSGNVFRNEHPANDPTLNFQRGFRVTSHSSATSTVSYVNNRVEGATVGIGWLEYSSPVAPPATVLPVVVEGNTLLGNQIGIWVFTDNLGTVTSPRMGKAIVRYNRMAGNATGLRNHDAEVMAENNWFGCSGGPAAPGCDPALYTGTAGFFDVDPWLTLGIALGAPSVEVGSSVPATATVTGNSAGAILGPIPFPVTDISFTGVKGTMASPVATADGTAVSSFTGTAVGIGTATAQLDTASASVQLLVTQGGTVLVQAFSETGGTPTPADNDYTRINEVVQLVSDGSTVELVGTFDWTEANAAASWAAGSDGVLATGDDYAIAAPADFQNVTIRAATPGGAVIQGPGDLPEANLEGFLGMWDGSYDGWTVENLDIRGFDLGIGMFYSGGTFSGVTIRNNRIELPADLNATVAPADVNQNIAIHLAIGGNQTIEGNEIVLAGDGISDTAGNKRAASVALQSNTHGGVSYNGLRIADNVIRVTGAQSADPEWIYGIWENGHAHQSTIDVVGNAFLNEAPDNDPLLNRQRAFRVTSHSSPSGSIVSYANNWVEGANIAIHWLGDTYTINPPATVEPILLTGNTLLGNGAGVWVHTDGTTELNSKARLRYNRIFGNGVGVRSDTALVMAENNWWGCNAGPGGAGCDTAVITGGGVLDADPWLTLGIALGAPSVEVGATIPATATVTGNSAGAALGPIPFPVTDIGFGGVRGTMVSPVATADGTALSSFTGTAVGVGTATAALDNATASAQLLVTQGGTVVVEAFSVTGGTPSLADNDYTRINDVVQLVADGSTVELVGSFDWTEPFAALSWERGSDGVAGTGDDYSILAPGNLQNVTIRAAAPGGAVIQGPGDLPGVNLEGFLGMWDGSYVGWTVENLDIRGFDLGIGMFFSSGAQFDGVTIRHNRIELPADLNATVAPDDVNQNIAIHLARGVNQTIEGNEFVLPGDGVSDTAGNKKAASVVLQSNTHGGASYDELRIVDNVIRVTGAQSADPEWIYGIWENGHAHASDIEISGNTFLNEDPGNDPLLNIQRAFRVTSHSSATTTVSYANNRVEGANIGIHWMGDGYNMNPPAAVLPVLVTGNTLLGNGTGVWVHTDGTTELNSKATLTFNRIYGNGVGVQSDTALVLAENNWWGCNAGPGGAGCDTAVITSGGVLDADPWLTLGIALGSSTIQLGDSTGVTASLRMNSDGADTSVGGFLPDGIPVAFGATGGVVDPAAGLTVLSLAGSTYTAGALPGAFAVSTEVDGQLVSTPVTLFAPDADLYATLLPEIQVVTDGGAVAWTATFGNTGPADATGAGISLAFAPELVGIAWTCSATGGAVCPAASGAGDITATVDLPSGGSLAYAVTGSAPTPFAGVLAVTATVNAPVTISDPDPTNDVAVATVRSPGLFEDGFESGDLSAWSGSL
ncbi:MAG TPA: hypothetical protein VLA75_03700 [Thermoanaerobaculia bacterium]|nr:hypothetical protein [Thermoanaerobaculia bacterium]